MSRTTTLKPTEIKSRKAKGWATWCLNVPAELSDTGKRRQLFYETKTDAQLASERLKVRKDNFGISLASMTPVRIAEASEAYKLLAGIDVSLIDAVKSYLASYKQRTASVPFLELFNEFLAAKADRNARYLTELRITRDRFPTLHGKIVSELTHLDLEPLLSGITPGGRNPVMRYLRAVFFFGIKKGYLKDNPISKLDFAQRKRKEIETISNEQAQAMLTHALENDLELLPFLVFGFFAGIRPDGELQKLEWSDIKLAESTIVIRPEVSKTNRRRFPDLSSNAAAWLNSYKAKGGKFEGKVSSYQGRKLQTQRRANWKAAGIENWIQQGMRHTFCSNWLAVHKDVNALVLQSGHDSVDTMWRNYHKGVSEADAKKFWAIAPPKRARKPKNVIQMVA
jgi:integrase